MDWASECLARAPMGLTLVGFLRGKRFIVYAGEERLSRAGAEVVAWFTMDRNEGK